MANPEPVDAAVAQQSPANPRSQLTTEELGPQSSTKQRISELRPKLFYEGWGIIENPFGVTPDPRYFYQSKTHAEASSSLIIGIECGVGFQALIAPPGMGKTTILFDILERFKEVASTGFLCQPQGNSSDLLRSLMAELGGEAHDSDLVQVKQVINDLLVRERRAGRLTIVIIDEAQSLATSVLETVRLLSNFETSTEKLLHIILAGQPLLAQRLASPDVAQLSQRISVLTTLVPFDLDDTVKYVDHRLKIAGYRRQPLFTFAALNLIWEHSRGIPREINKLCFNAMLLARAAGQRRVDSEILQEVVADFDLERLRYKFEAPSTEMKGVQTADRTRAETEEAKLGAAIADELSRPASHDGPDVVVVRTVKPEASVCNNRTETSSLPGIAAADLASTEAEGIEIEAASRRVTNAETAAESDHVQQPTSERSIKVAVEPLWAEVQPGSTEKPEPAREITPHPLTGLDRNSTPADNSGIKHSESDSAVSASVVLRTPSHGSLADSKLDLAKNSVPHLGLDPDSEVQPAGQAGKNTAMAMPIAAHKSVIPGLEMDQVMKLSQLLHEINHELDAASGIHLDSKSEEKPEFRVDSKSDFASVSTHKDETGSKLGDSGSSSDFRSDSEFELRSDLRVVTTIEKKSEPSSVASAFAAADRLRVVFEGLFGEPTGSRWGGAWQLPVWTRAQWQSHKASIYVGGAAVILSLVLLWTPAVTPPQGRPELSTLEQLLITLGLHEPSPRRVPEINPEARVWIDVQTGLYYCHGGEMYGKTPGGKFKTQQDAQQSRFRPANHKACP
jgi:general secretion pathway protein A